jgi:hypothetical protein
MWLRWEATAAAAYDRCAAVKTCGRWLASLALPLALLILPAGAASAPLGATTTPAACTLVASPTGSDSGSGTPAAPFQTVQKLISSLTPGQTGCVKQGTYDEDVTFRTSGTATAPITLTSYPGQTATIVGRMYIVDGANYVTVTGLDLNGENPQQALSPMIDANNATFSYDNVTNDHTGTCFGIGSATWGWATGTLITHDTIHDCGQLPATNSQHGLYIGAATNTTIAWSLIYGNADRGIQLYPDAQHTTIDHDIIDDNGEGIIISGAGGVASSYTNVYDNILSNANVRHDVESYWPPGNPVGVDNTVHNNCIWGGREGGIGMADGGYRASQNLKASPQFVNEAAHDYELRATSPCLLISGDPQAAVDGTTPVQPTASAMVTMRRLMGSGSRSHSVRARQAAFFTGEAAEVGAGQLR